MVFLFLTSDTWAFCAAIDPLSPFLAAIAAVLGGTAALYFGQGFHTLARVSGHTARQRRLRAVVSLTLGLGLFSLWWVVFAAAFLLALAMPAELVAEWSGRPDGADLLFTFAGFVATLGITAAVFGGNLEDEREIKALLLIDREF